MHAYRAYFLGGDGVIFSRVELGGEDDETAIERAKVLVDGHDVEVWDGARQVAFKTTKSKQQP